MRTVVKSSYLHIVTLNWKTKHEYAGKGGVRGKAWSMEVICRRTVWSKPLRLFLMCPQPRGERRYCVHYGTTIKLLPLPREKGRPQWPDDSSVITQPPWPENLWSCIRHINNSQSNFQAAMLVQPRNQYSPEHKDRCFCKPKSDPMVTSLSGCGMSHFLSLPRCWVDISGERGNSHLLLAVSWFLWEHRLQKHLVCLPCIYLFIHAWRFVPGVTQAYHIPGSNKLKIASAEILTSYFPAGKQSRLVCLSQNI